MMFVRRPPWMAFAACRGKDPNLFHPDKSAHADRTEALAICNSCAARAACLDYALSLPAMCTYGVWGGTNEKQRRLLRNERKIA